MRPFYPWLVPVVLFVSCGSEQSVPPSAETTPQMIQPAVPDDWDWTQLDTLPTYQQVDEWSTQFRKQTALSASEIDELYARAMQSFRSRTDWSTSEKMSFKIWIATLQTTRIKS